MAIQILCHAPAVVETRRQTDIPGRHDILLSAWHLPDQAFSPHCAGHAGQAELDELIDGGMGEQDLSPQW
jgi:hypothetical protein